MLCSNSPAPRKVDRNPSIRVFHPASKGLEQNGSWYPYYQTQVTLGPDSAEWVKSEQAPGMVSLFDDMVLLYPLTARDSTSEMKQCTDVCRRLVLSAWTAWLRIIEAQVTQERRKMSTGDADTAKDLDDILKLSWARPWDTRDFSRLVLASGVLESIEAELRRNVEAMGVGSHPQSQILSPWEEDAWRSLQESVKLSKCRVDGILQTYMQVVSVRQSLTASEEAHQVGHLTSLATIFIPASFIAAVLSMGGDFAAGEARFWVFWVIATPMMSLGCFLLFTDVGRRLLRQVAAGRCMIRE